MTLQLLICSGIVLLITLKDGRVDATTTIPPADCGTPATPVNGAVSYATTTVGSVADYTCSVGYTLSGSTSAVCQSDATWSAIVPTCDIVDCGTPSSPLNGNVILTTTTYTSMATYGCNIGYSLSGSATTSCLSDGTWLGPVPTCVIMDCGPLSPPVNGTVSFTTTTYGSVAAYTCNMGLVPGGPANVSCMGNGLWNAVVTSCVLPQHCVAIYKSPGPVVSIMREVESTDTLPPYVMVATLTGLDLVKCVRSCQGQSYFMCGMPGECTLVRYTEATLTCEHFAVDSVNGAAITCAGGQPCYLNALFNF